jgi:predicted DNA-binding transcriptional regulator YafY
MYRRGEIGQVARALRVLDGLRGFKHGRWVSELAAEVCASERTVRRDITELQDAGFDIEVTRREN